MSARSRTLLLWWLLALLIAAGFASLGRWQLARMHEKQAMLTRAQFALDRTHPQPLLLASDSARRAGYDWAAGSGDVANLTLWLDNQQRNGRVGVRMYCLMFPDDGAQALLLDAGWWPLGGRRDLPELDCPAGKGQGVRGMLTAPPSEGLVHGAALEKRSQTRWLMARMDVAAIQQTLQLRTAIAPRVLRLDPSRQKDDAEVMLATGERDLEILANTMTPERHLGYAVQWFGLAACVLVVAAVMTFKKKNV